MSGLGKKIISLGEKPKGFGALSRRDFMKAVTYGSAAALLTACAPQAAEQTNSPFSGIENNTNHEIWSSVEGGPSLPFLWAMTGVYLASTPGAEPFIKDPAQRDVLFGAYVGNQLSVADGNIVTEQALNEGRAIAGSFCSDSRLLIARAKKFRAMSMSQTTEEIFMVESRLAGAQPSLFDSRINKSLFVSHEATLNCGTGCGFLGGAEELFNNGAEGLSKLKAHGVPDETLYYIDMWNQAYGEKVFKAFKDSNKTPSAKEWAEIGAHMQAYMNSNYNTKRHYVLYGVQQHGEGSFIPDGVIDDLGVKYTLREALDFAPELVGAAEYLNQPHSAIESLVKGQKPNANVISVSKHSPQALFGDEFIQPGETFVINQTSFPNGSVTPESLDGILASKGYSLGALEQRAKTIFLVADTTEEMAIVRRSLLGSAQLDKFLKEGGLIVELITDENGLFNKTAVLRSLENPLAYLTISGDEKIRSGEAVITKNGASKIFGAIRIADTVQGETVSVIVESARDRSLYELQVPKGSAYSAITLEALEKAGLPAFEALWYEKAFLTGGKLLGTLGMAAGLVWMAYDGVNYAADVMGLGDTMEFSRYDYANIQDGELRQAVNDLGLELTPAGSEFKGNNLRELDFLLSRRVQNHIIEAGQGITPKSDSVRIKLDSNVANIPFVLSDGAYDVGTSIEVIPISHKNYDFPIGDEKHVVVDSIIYKNSANGETLTVTVNNTPDGNKSYSIPDGTPKSLFFETIIANPKRKEELLSIPLEFTIGTDGVELIRPHYTQTVEN